MVAGLPNGTCTKASDHTLHHGAHCPCPDTPALRRLPFCAHCAPVVLPCRTLLTIRALRSVSLSATLLCCALLPGCNAWHTGAARVKLCHSTGDRCAQAAGATGCYHHGRLQLAPRLHAPLAPGHKQRVCCVRSVSLAAGRSDRYRYRYRRNCYCHNICGAGIRAHLP